MHFTGVVAATLAVAGTAIAVPSELTPFDLVHGIKLIQAPGDKLKILCPAPSIASIECEGNYCNACCGECCQCIKSKLRAPPLPPFPAPAQPRVPSW